MSGTLVAGVHQSAYKQLHSTEIVFLEVYDDIT